MKKLYVGWQNQDTREWIPVAKLEQTDIGYKLIYTSGAQRCRGFSGFGRMNNLGESYFSRELFQFFENRVIKKSRPEYKRYLEWLDLTDPEPDALTILQVTGGIRSTDNFEIFSPPSKFNNKFLLNFFPRGLRRITKENDKEIKDPPNGKDLIIEHDIENKYDNNALILKTENPSISIGYIPKYYTKGLKKAIDSNSKIRAFITKINNDAPIDMRVLCRLEIESPENDVDLLSVNEDFNDLNYEKISLSNEKIIINIAKYLGSNE